jgi:hypothetical protein
MQSVSLVELGHGGVLVFCANEETIIYKHLDSHSCFLGSMRIG